MTIASKGQTTACGKCDLSQPQQETDSLSLDVDTVKPYTTRKKRLSPRERIALIRDSIHRLRTEDFDTTRDEGYWKRALVHGRLDLYDTGISYPRFLDFALKVYRWGDRTFNSYDTAYVVGTGKNWKLMVRNNNWLDSYAGRLSDENVAVNFNSSITASLGVQISFMAVSYSYMYNLNKHFSNDAGRQFRWDFSFTCSRFSFEAYKHRNSRSVTGYIRDLQQNNGYNFRDAGGVTHKSHGMNLWYFFNHMKYSQGAAYTYSKIQRRSAGSWIAGLLYSNQDLDIDFNNDDNADNPFTYRYHYREFNLLGGYAYNWVFHSGWLFNITVAPTIGFKHSFLHSIGGEDDHLSASFKGRLGLVRNKGNFFYAMQFLVDGHLFTERNHTIFNSTEDLNFIAGFRF